jgi:ribosomal protein S8
VLGGIRVANNTTTKGVMSDRESPKHGVGGEVLAYLY